MVKETLKKLVFGSESIQIRIDMDLFKPDPVRTKHADPDPIAMKKMTKFFTRSNQIILIRNALAPTRFFEFQNLLSP